jgi:hypothetical protein
MLVHFLNLHTIPSLTLMASLLFFPDRLSYKPLHSLRTIMQTAVVISQTVIVPILPFLPFPFSEVIQSMLGRHSS